MCAFNDKPNRLLQDPFEIYNQITIQICLSIYRSENYKFAGLEWKIKCYFDDDIQSSSKWTWPTKCDGCCPGDLNQACQVLYAFDLCFSATQFVGGSWQFNLFTPAIILVPSSVELISHRGEIQKFQINEMTIQNILEKTEEQIKLLNAQIKYDRSRSSLLYQMEPNAPQTNSSASSIFLTCNDRFVKECYENVPDETLDEECTGILMFAKAESNCKCSMQNSFGRNWKHPVKRGWSKFTRLNLNL